jgi:hypothetical protein
MQTPQMPRRASQLPPSPTHVITLLLGQSGKRYQAIKEMIKNQTDGFFDLQKESQQLAQFMQQEDGTVDVRIHRLAFGLQAVLAAAEINRRHLEQHLQAEMFLQGELNRFLRGQPPTRFQGPALSPEMSQPIVPGYTPPAQLPPGPVPQPAALGQGQPQQGQAPAQPEPPSYFRQTPNGFEVQFPPGAPQAQPQLQGAPPAFPIPGYAAPPGYPQQQPQVQQPAQMQPPPALQGQQMFGPWPPPPGYAAPVPPPGYAPPGYAAPPPGYYPPPGYGYPQQQPTPLLHTQLPVMEQGHAPAAQPQLAPVVPQAAPQQTVNGPPPSAAPVYFPTPGAPQGADQANGAPQPTK